MMHHEPQLTATNMLVNTAMAHCPVDERLFNLLAGGGALFRIVQKLNPSVSILVVVPFIRQRRKLEACSKGTSVQAASSKVS